MWRGKGWLTLVNGIVLLVAVAASPGSAAAQAASTAPAWERFTAANPGAWRAEWSAGGRQIVSLRGLSPASAGDSVGIAAGFTAANSDLLGLAGGMRDLTLVGERRSAGGTHLRYRQKVGMLPVLNGFVDVSVNRAGQVYLVQNAVVDAVPLQSLSVQPRLTRQQVAAIAQSLETAITDKHGRPLALPLQAESAPLLGVQRLANGGARLAYRVELGAVAVVVDAQNGAVLDRIIRMQSAKGKGTVFDPNPVNTLNNNSLTDRGNKNYQAVRDAYFQRTLLGLTKKDGRFLLAGPYVRMLDLKASSVHTCMNGQNELRLKPPKSGDGTFKFNRSQSGFEHVNVYYHLDASQRYIQSLGFDSLWNVPIRVDAHAFTIDNSFYCGAPEGAGYLAFGDGGVDDAEETDVVLHEYGHALQDAASGGRYLAGGQAGAMGEGFGDYWSYSANPDGPWADCFAEWDADARCLRRLDKNKKFPANYIGEVHADGEIWSRGLRDMLMKLGKKKADRIILESHFLVPSKPSFKNGLNALLDADQSLYGGANKSKICSIFASRGISSPQC